MKSYSTRVQEQKRRRADAAGSLGSRKLPDVRQIVGVECPDLWPLQGEQRHSVAIIADEFHFKGYSLAVHEHSGPDVASHQSVRWYVAGESDGIEFIDDFHRIFWAKDAPLQIAALCFQCR